MRHVDCIEVRRAHKQTGGGGEQATSWGHRVEQGEQQGRHASLRCLGGMEAGHMHKRAGECGEEEAGDERGLQEVQGERQGMHQAQGEQGK